MRSILTAAAALAVLGLAACEQPAPPPDIVAADEAATETPETAPPTSPAQATDADRAAEKQGG